MLEPGSIHTNPKIRMERNIINEDMKQNLNKAKKARKPRGQVGGSTLHSTAESGLRELHKGNAVPNDFFSEGGSTERFL